MSPDPKCVRCGAVFYAGHICSRYLRSNHLQLSDSELQVVREALIKLRIDLSAQLDGDPYDAPDWSWKIDTCSDVLSHPVFDKVRRVQ